MGVSGLKYFVIPDSSCSNLGMIISRHHFCLKWSTKRDLYIFLAI